MIVNRDKQFELIILAIFWVFAVLIQVSLCQIVDNYISEHIFRDDFVASSQFQAWVASTARDRLFWGGCLSLLCGWGTILLKGQIELETALYLTGLVAVSIGAIPLMLGMGHTNWRYPLFFIECAPLAALLWQGLYRALVWFEDWKSKRADKAKNLKNDVKAVKSESPSIVTEQRQVQVEEAKIIKKEDKPIEKPKEPPVEQNSIDNWSLD